MRPIQDGWLSVMIKRCTCVHRALVANRSAIHCNISDSERRHPAMSIRFGLGQALCVETFNPASEARCACKVCSRHARLKDVCGRYFLVDTVAYGATTPSWCCFRAKGAAKTLATLFRALRGVISVTRRVCMAARYA